VWLGNLEVSSFLEDFGVLKNGIKTDVKENGHESGE
jgi:hypothetical protein